MHNWTWTIFRFHEDIRSKSSKIRVCIVIDNEDTQFFIYVNGQYNEIFNKNSTWAGP